MSSSEDKTQDGQGDRTAEKPEIVEPNPEPKATPDLANTSIAESTGTKSPNASVNEQNETPDHTLDPNYVNIHQFFPTLEHCFTKTSTHFAEEQDNRMEAAIKDFVNEDSTVFSQFSEQENSTVPESFGDKQLVILEREGTDLSYDSTTAPDNNNSADRQQSTDKHMILSFWGTKRGQPTNQRQYRKKQTDDNVFRTAVDEETLEAAKARSGNSIFNTEEWPGPRAPSPTYEEILVNKAAEHYERAMELKAQGNHAASIRSLNKAINLQPKDHLLYMERAENFMQLTDFQSAILNYKKACLLAPNNDNYYSRLAFLYYFQGQMLFDQRLYPESLELFSRAAEMKPEKTGYHIRCISCLAALQRHGECLALVDKRLEIDKNNADLLIMRARLHEMFRNTTLCYYDVKDALAIDENHEVAMEMMANLKLTGEDNKKQAMQLNIMGKHREALQKISIAIETNPSISSYHVLRGALHRKLGDFNSAIDDFLLALDKCDHNEEDPVYSDSQRQLLLTYNDFAVECFNKGYYDEAVILLNKAIKGEKKEKGLYINRGDCFLKQDELNFALQDYHQALELDPSDVYIKTRISVIHAEFAYSAYHEKNYSEALAKMSLAIQYNPNVGGYYISRARSKYMLEDVNGAKQDLILGMLLDPTNEDIVTIINRLFPGKSVAEIINSKQADPGRLALQHLFPTASPVRLQPLPPQSPDREKTSVSKDSSSDPKPHPPPKPKSLWKPEKCVPDLKLCIEEQEFNLRFAKAKKKIDTKLKQSYHNRKTLKSSAPRMQPLPPPTSKTRYGANVFQRQELIVSETPELKKSTKWKTYGLGIGTQ